MTDKITFALLVAVITVIGGIGGGMVFIVRLFLQPLQQQLARLEIALEQRRQDDKQQFIAQNATNVKVAYIEGFLRGAKVLNGD